MVIQVQEQNVQLAFKEVPDFENSYFIDDNIILFGDYNLPHLVSHYDTKMVSNVNCDEFCVMGLSQFNYNYNKNNLLLLDL